MLKRILEKVLDWLILGGIAAALWLGYSSYTRYQDERASHQAVEEQNAALTQALTELIQAQTQGICSAPEEENPTEP